MAVVLVAVAYLLGSFPSGVVIGRFRGRDVRSEGSGNIGAANAARVLGRAAGAGVGALDIVKGVVAVVVARWAGTDAGVVALVALAAVVGHDFSVFLGFKGGKGVATTIGVALALSFPAGMVVAAVWVGVALIARISSVASLAALACLPIALAVTGGPIWYVELGFVLFVLAVVKHRGNIARLLRGTEPGWGKK